METTPSPLTDLSTLPDDLDDGALAAELTRRAATLASEMRARGLQGHEKTSVSDVVTAADHAAEAFVTAALAALRPDDGIVGEEGASAASTSGRTWVIDPVDGTYNFLSGLSYWCSALALRDDEGVLVGAVHHPGQNEAWLGVRGRRTTLNGVELPPLTDATADRSCLATYLHPTRLADPTLLTPWSAMTQRTATVRMFGSSSCDLAAVAGGRIEAWAQHAVLEWDWLPGQALVLGVGGVTELVEHRGHTWSLAGRPSAVAELADAIRTS